MNWHSLQDNTQATPLFTISDLVKWYPTETENQIQVQLSRFVKSGRVWQPRKGIYLVTTFQINDPFVLANFLREPSYISLESALNYYGLIPDIPSAVTSITTKKTKTYQNTLGKFIYKSVKPELFFGFEYVPMRSSPVLGYNIAVPEKALLDYLQLNSQLDSLDEIRLRSIEDFSREKLAKFAQWYSRRVQKVVKEI